MSHELRTPLNSLLMLAEQLENNPDGNMTDVQVEYASVIRSSGQDLLALLNGILDLAKVESGTVVAKFAKVSVEALCETLRSEFAPVEKVQGLEFSVGIDPECPKSLITDLQRLRQIMKNLLANAFKFTADGGVHVTIGSAQSGWSAGSASLADAAAVVAFSVSDTGIGIKAEDHVRILEEFAQCDGSTGRSHGGTGLGLSNSRNLANLLNGNISVASTPGKGSTFTLYLPVDELAGQAKLVDPESATPVADEPRPATKAAEPVAHRPVVERDPEPVMAKTPSPAETMQEESGDLTGIIGVSADITDLTSAQELLARTAAQQTAVAELGRYALAADDIASVARAAETAITGILGADEWHARVNYLDEPDAAPAEEENGAIIRIDVGETAVISVWNDHGSPLSSDGHHFVSDVASHLDSMLRRAGANVEFEHLATHDPLTELPNRTLFLDRLLQIRNGSDRNGHRHAVLFLDLDGFKFVNDGLGHDVGDQLLLAVVERLRSIMRPSDTLARFGGDEFAILCPNIANERTALAVGARIQTALDMPFQLKSMELMATASIGIALGDASTDGGDLLRDADTAMYRAKDGGRNRVALFDEDIQCKAQDHLARAAGLRGALGNGEIFPHYHPIVDLASGRVVGVEALARWRRPSGEMVAPDVFIGLAEEIGLIEALGRHILRTACRDALAWTRSNPAPFMLSVNVSPRQFSSGDVASMVLSILEETGFDANHLLLEITESALMIEPSVQTTIGELRKHGVKFAIDDFGTGYSSLASLRQLPVDFLKIDQSFVSGITTDAQDRALITAAIDLARSFGLTTIAEGVETREQLRELAALDCNMAQGYLWTRPVEAAQIADLVEHIGKVTHASPIHARQLETSGYRRNLSIVECTKDAPETPPRSSRTGA